MQPHAHHTSANGISGNAVPPRPSGQSPVEPTVAPVNPDDDFIPMHKADWEAMLPGALSGEWGEDPGREREFCAECGSVHASGNVRRCRYLQEQRLADAVAARMAAANAPRVAEDVELTDAVREQFIAWLAGQGYSPDRARGWQGPGGQCGLSRCHMRAHVQSFFPRLSVIVEPGRIGEYIATSLASRSWSTVQKECFTLRLLLQFSATRGWIINPPNVPDPPETAMGVRDPNRKEHAIDLTSELWEALLAALPEEAAKSRFKGKRVTPIRDAVTLQYEVMRRPTTIESLLKGKHWRPEFGKKLLITPAIDKNGKKRARRGAKPEWVALSDCAYEIVQRRAAEVADGEPIIGRYRSTARRYIIDAARAIGLPDDVAEHVSAYDGRHNGIRHAVDETGDLRGVSAQCGTSIATLSKHYLDSDEKQASRMMATREASAKNLKLVRLPIPPPSRGGRDE